MEHNIVLSDGTRIKRGEDLSDYKDRFYCPPGKYAVPIDRLHEKKILYMDISDLRLKGLTLKEIGKKKNLTGERIRQILQKYFPDIPKRLESVGTIDKKCLRCSKISTYLNYSANRKRIYCGLECRSLARVTNGERGWRHLPLEEKRKYYRERMRLYYPKIKNKEWFKHTVWKNNTKATLKRQLKKGKITQKEYDMVIKKINGN